MGVLQSVVEQQQQGFVESRFVQLVSHDMKI